MDYAAVLARCRGLPGATEGYPFGEGALVFKVGGKMFAILSAPTPRLRTRVPRVPRVAAGLPKGQTWFGDMWVARWDAEPTLVRYGNARSSRGEMWNARSSDG